MSKLSQPMMDVLTTATETSNGYAPVTGAPRTITALKTRGLVTDDGLFLTDAGAAVRAELINDLGDVNPVSVPDPVDLGSFKVGDRVFYLYDGDPMSRHGLPDGTVGTVVGFTVGEIHSPIDVDFGIVDGHDYTLTPVSAGELVRVDTSGLAPLDFGTAKLYSRENPAVEGEEFTTVPTVFVVPNRKDRRSVRRLAASLSRATQRRFARLTRKHGHRHAAMIMAAPKAA